MHATQAAKGTAARTHRIALIVRHLPETKPKDRLQPGRCPKPPKKRWSLIGGMRSQVTASRERWASVPRRFAQEEDAVAKGGAARPDGRRVPGPRHPSGGFVCDLDADGHELRPVQTISLRCSPISPSARSSQPQAVGARHPQAVHPAGHEPAVAEGQGEEGRAVLVRDGPSTPSHPPRSRAGGTRRSRRTSRCRRPVSSPSTARRRSRAADSCPGRPRLSRRRSG